MADSQQDYYIRHPSAEDFERVFEFMVTCDIADYGEPDTDKVDLEDQWNEVDLSKDAWIAVTNTAELGGYALVSGEGERCQMDFYPHRTHPSPGIAAELVQRCELRVRERMMAEETASAVLTGFAAGVNAAARIAYEEQGFTIVNRHYRMQMDFHEPLSAPIWPGGFEVSPFKPEDERELFALITSAFDWPGRRTVSIDEWRDHLFRNGRFEPELFVMVRRQGRLVGAALSYDEGTRGWIRQLAIAKDLQGQGFGSLLLRHMLSLFYNRNLPYAALGVSARNEKALKFYERCGMRQTREFIEYRKRIA